MALNQEEQAKVVADVFEEAGWQTTPVKGAKWLSGGFWFNASHPSEPSRPATIWLVPFEAKMISVDAIDQRIRSMARNVLLEARLGKHLTSSW